MLKTCTHCHATFNAEARRAKYCSRDCYQAHKGRPDAHDRICIVCGNAYTAYSSTSKYCSQSCYNSERQLPTATCECCHSSFTPKRNNQRFCSKKCINRNIPDAHCSYCGKRFHPRTVKKSKFCSLECYHASMSTEYPRSRLNFSNTEKRTILDRDNHRCVQCGTQDNLEIDHILAICNGGKRSVDNGQTLCASCHNAKTVIDKETARSRLNS